MSLSDLDVKKIYPGDGSTTSFAITADFDSNSEIKVIVRDEGESPPTETLKTLGTDYSISSGNVVFVTAPASDQKVMIIRENPLTQAVDLIGSGALGVETLESSLDKLTKITQELSERVDRSAKLPETYPNEGSGSISELFLGEPSASKLLRWNSSANALEAVSAGDVDLVTVPVTTKGDLFSYDTGAARLGVGSNGRFLQADSNQTIGLRYTSLMMPVPSWRVLAGGPAQELENNLIVYLFDDAASQKLSALIRIPEFYIAGTQLNLKLCSYSASSSGTNKFRSTTTLLEPGSSAVTSTTNQHVSTNSALALGSANRVEVHTLDLTDVDGEVNSVAVAAGDLLLVVLERDSDNDSDTASVRVLADSIGVTL